VPLIVSSVAHANVLMRKIFKKLLFGAPTHIHISFVLASAMQLTIKMTLRHNFISILAIVDVSLFRCLSAALVNIIMNGREREGGGGEKENINQLMTISKERINLNLLTPNRRQRRVKMNGGVGGRKGREIKN
jgi:hypothetical protein